MPDKHRRDKGRVSEQRWRRERRINEAQRSYKARPCHDCGVQYPFYVMQLDHRPGTPKRKNPSDCNSMTAFMREAEHCDVVCANCHATRTWIRSAWHNHLDKGAAHPELPFD